MMISADDLEFEVLRIFDKLRIPMGHRLSQATLTKAWIEERLRYDDLTHTTQRLVKDDVLKKEQTTRGVQYQLTLGGCARVVAMRRHRILGALQNLRIHALLALMRKDAALDAARRHDV